MVQASANAQQNENRLARLRAGLAGNTLGPAQRAAYEARIRALEGASFPAAASDKGGGGEYRGMKQEMPAGMSPGPNSQAGVPAGFYRTANGQIIPIAQGLAPTSVYNQYAAQHPEINPAAQTLQGALAAINARLAAGQAAHQANMQAAYGGLLTPENLAALGMNPATTADQLTNLQISALYRAAAQPQIAGQVAASDEAGQAALAAGGQWAGPVPQAGGIPYDPKALAGLLTAEEAAATASPAGTPALTPDLYAAQHPGLAPGLLDYYRRAYEQALARYTGGGEARTAGRGRA